MKFYFVALEIGQRIKRTVHIKGGRLRSPVVCIYCFISSQKVGSEDFMLSLSYLSVTLHFTHTEHPFT
jgi:hypothetical protein